MSGRKNVKISETVHSKLANKKYERETWDQFLLRLAGEEARPEGTYEEATLQFKQCLESNGGTSVDLLVEISTGSEGWSIDTKRVTDTGYNVNDRDGRAQIAEALSKGKSFPLYVGNDNEEFRVSPELTWRVDDLSNPIVADIEFKDPKRE